MSAGHVGAGHVRGGEAHDDFAFEPVRGLPQMLPPGESILWQGAPDFRTAARRVFHVRKLAVYFAALVIWGLVSAVSDGMGLVETLVSVGVLAALSVAGLALVTLFAWGVARTTVYTVTQRRLVMRIGVALPITFNIPFAKIEQAAVKLNDDGSGDIALRLVPGERLAYLVMWPHARPWRFARVEPSLRGLADVEAVAQKLARAVAAASGQPVRATALAKQGASQAGELSGSAA